MDEIKRIDPITGIVNTFSLVKDSILAGGIENLPHREDVFRDEVNKIIIDTCCAPDTGCWETGICKDEEEAWIIVEQYETREEAEEGHKKWVQAIKDNPDQELEDLDLWGLGL